MDTRKFSLARSSGGGPFLLVCTSDAVLNNFYSCSSSSMSLLMYFSTLFVGEERGTNPMCQVLYVVIDPG